jgi:hypothetical protein
MDFQNRGTQPQTVAPNAHVAPATPQSAGRKNRLDRGKWNRAGLVAAVAVVVILLLAVVAYIGVTNNSTADEASYVNTSKLQAVFLNTGQVYFGNIKSLNNTYFVLTNIYYLQTSSASGSSSTSTSNTSVSLVKLGCELHAPYDQMVINSSQVTFWENLQSSGQVAQAVAKFEAANPNGQKCADQSSSSGSTSGSVQSANSNATPSDTTK